MLHTIKIILIVLAIVVALILIIRRIYKSYPRKTLALYKGVSWRISNAYLSYNLQSASQGTMPPRVFVDLDTGEITQREYSSPLGPKPDAYEYYEKYKLQNGETKEFTIGPCKTENPRTEKCEEYGYLTYNLYGKHVFKRDDSVKQAFEEALEAEYDARSSQDKKRKQNDAIKCWFIDFSHAFLPLLCVLFTYVFSTLVSSEAWNNIILVAIVILYIYLSWLALNENKSDNSGRILLFCWIGFAIGSIPFALWQFASIRHAAAQYNGNAVGMSAIIGLFASIKALWLTITYIAAAIKEKMWNK